MKKFICVIILCAILTLCCTSCQENRIAPALKDINLTSTSSIDNIKISEKPTDYVIIDVKDEGKIVIRLFPNVAPETVKNFKSLVEEKFYDGIIFHRVQENFMIQTGDPDGDGTGGSDQNIKGEFNLNGFENNLLHFRGVVSMARTDASYDSASSQFFILHRTTASLDGAYASFGYVVYGMDVVDSIAETATVSDRPVKDIVMNSIRFADVSDLTFDINFGY